MTEVAHVWFFLIFPLAMSCALHTKSTLPSAYYSPGTPMDGQHSDQRSDRFVLMLYPNS